MAAAAVGQSHCAVVLIVESNPSGHRLSYVRVIADQARSDGHAVRILLGGRCEGHENFGLHLSQYDCVVSFGGENLSIGEMEQFSLRVNATVVVVPDGDTLLVPLLRRAGWSGGGRVRLLVMRAPRFETRGLRRFVKSMVIWVAARARRTTVLTLVSSVEPAPGHHEVRDPARLVHDQRVAPPDGHHRILMIGAITPRKNPELVIDSVALLDRPDVELVVAGTVANSCARTIAEAPDRLSRSGVKFVHDARPLSDDEFDAYVSSSSVVVLAHSNNGPSGVLAKAALAGVNVVAAGAPSLRADCDVLGNGAEWTSLRAPDIAAAIERALATRGAKPFPAATESEFARKMMGL
ncbi:glycosyltransferase [Nakamurella flava]|uniref:Glycosyltransferase n=1 Tax=Nakamurella flava TaxID=2576308 RepID=A0A4U6QBU3_9ACTN|nr:glycosyltransferase [Nakamurella flava]TKV57356.1 glycosyltransferase [Nakamurella flava]